MSNIKKLTFNIDKYDLQEINNSQLAILEMWVVSEGQNAHKMPITRDAIISAASSIIGKPVLYKYNPKTDDFEAHETDEISCGVLALNKAEYSFKEDDEGKLWLVCKAYIWKMYYPEVVEIFARDEQKAISMEILVVDSEVDENAEAQNITAFSFTGVTLLGDIYRPAIKNANATVEKFSEMVKETERLLYSNIDEKVVEKEVKKVTFIKKDFAASYSYTVNEVFDIFNKQCSAVKYMDGDYESQKYYCRDFCSKYAYVSDWETGKCMAIPYNKDLTLDMATVQECRMRYIVEDQTPEGDAPEVTPEDEMAINLCFTKEEVNEKVKTFSEKIETVKTENETKINDLTTNFETEKTQFSEKITNLEKTNSELLEFKENVMKQHKEQELNFALDSVKDVLNEDQIKEWSAKVDEFDNIEIFKNAIQAYAFTLSKPNEQETKTRIHIPIEADLEVKKSKLWD